VALPGELFEFFGGEAVFGADVFWGFGFGIGGRIFFPGGLRWRCWGGLEALAEVGEATEGEGLADEVGGSGEDVNSAEGGVSGGGEEEVGLEAQGGLDGFEGGEEARLAEPAAEDGGGGPVLGGGPEGWSWKARKKED